MIELGLIGALSLVSIRVGTQYEERLAMPPRQVELPVPRIDSAVEFASVPVLPKNEWRCERPGSPGKTIGASNDMWANTQRIRNSPPLAGAISSVGATFRALVPVAGGGILEISTTT